jgi:hypothetical protein
MEKLCYPVIVNYSSRNLDWFREAFLDFLDRVLDTCFIPSSLKTLIRSAAKSQIGPFLRGDNDWEEEA